MRQLTIKRRTRPVHLVCPVLYVLILPQRPNAIDLRVMQIKSRVPARGIRVDTLPTHRKMSARMHSVESLEISIEATEIGTAVDDSRHVRRFRVIAPEQREVADEAARVVSEAVVAVHGRKSNGAQVDGVVGERARIDAAAAGAGGKGELHA